MARRLYEVIGVDPDATTKRIVDACLQLGEQYKKQGNVGDAAEKFAEVKQAYETLTDPERRRAYDAMEYEPSVPIQLSDQAYRAILGGIVLLCLIVPIYLYGIYESPEQKAQKEYHAREYQEIVEAAKKRSDEERKKEEEKIDRIQEGERLNAESQRWRREPHSREEEEAQRTVERSGFKR